MQRLGLAAVSVDHARLTLTARLDGIAPEDVARELVTGGVRLQGLAVERPDLEDLFVSITGEGFDVLR
jgi:ABC-2 type transport system ATP-binding protein